MTDHAMDLVRVCMCVCLPQFWKQVAIFEKFDTRFMQLERNPSSWKFQFPKLIIEAGQAYKIMR
jgi:hypothetical protein